MKNKILTLPPAMTEAFASAEPGWASRAHAFCDPPGSPLGSAGGAMHALAGAWRAETGGKTPFETWLGTGPVRHVIHAGGESRRLPSYATAGKAFIPVPVFRWSWGGRLDQTLLDVQNPLLEAVAHRAPPSARLLIASGDVAVIAPPPAAVPEADVIIAGLWAPPEEARNFGVLFCERDDPGRLVTFLQKPSPDRIAALAEQHLFLVDIGVWMFSARAVERLMARCGWKSDRGEFSGGQASRCDLYQEWALGLGSRPDRPDPGLDGLTVAVLPLRDGEFYHFGSSRDIVRSVHRLQNRVLDQTRLNLGGLRPHPRQFVQNAVLDRPLDMESSHTLWIENSHVPAGWKMDREHILTGIPENRWALRLEPGVCLDWTPLRGGGSGEGALRAYGFEDAFRGSLGSASTRWLGRPAADWFARRGIDPALAGGADVDLQQARLFPVWPFDSIESDLVEWMFAAGPAHRPEFAERWKRARRLSASELMREADVTAAARMRETRRYRTLPALAANWRRSIFYRIDLDAAADAFTESGTALPPPPALQPGDPPLIAAHDAMLRSAVARRAGDADAAGRHEQEAFAVLRRRIVEAARRRPVAPAGTLLEDQILWARSPVRLDWAGGWTDTPPYCLEHGGRVLNLAVELNGQPPIQVFVRRTDRPVIVVRSIDLGLSEEIRSFEEVARYAQLGSGFAIARAALALAGFHPDFCSVSHSSLERQLAAMGGGLELTLLCALPKGSGLGTSSILAATTLGALSEFGGLGWDRTDLLDRTLALEQMLGSGGGWQDQAGGLYPGAKLIETDPGFDQRPRIRWLSSAFLDQPEIAGRMLLYYTGITRVARGILGEIVRGLFLNRGDTLRVVDAIGRNAVAGYEAFQRQDFAGIEEVVRRSWEWNKALDSGANTPSVQAILDQCGDDLSAAKLLGAGGGGYLFMIARDTAAASRIREHLSARPPNPRARLVQMTLSKTGLQITKS